MNRNIAIFGGSFNPPTITHRTIADKLSSEFDQVIVIPCGLRPDKDSVNVIDLLHRREMVLRGFDGLPENVVLDLLDLDQHLFRRTHTLQKYWEKQGTLWHVVGSDIIQGGREEKSLIHTVWVNGPRLWQELNFAVIIRPPYNVGPEDMPPHSRRSDWGLATASSEVQANIQSGRDWNNLVPPQVADYIETHQLWRPQCHH